MTNFPLGKAGVLAAALALVASTNASGATAPPGVAARAAAGQSGPAITLFNGTYLREHDVVVAPSGTAYAAWSTSSRTVSVCALPPGATACAGVATIDSIGDARQLELTLDAAGAPTAVWMYDTDASVSGPMGARLATATVQPDGSLSPASVVAEAPSNGSMYSVTRAPDGRIWAVVQPGAGKTGLLVYPGLTSPVGVATPYYVGDARLAFTGGLDGVLAIAQYGGSLSQPVASAALTGGAFGGFTNVPGTWNVHGFGLVASPGGPTLVASDDSASYDSVRATWTGTGFSQQARLQVGSCTATGHDLQQVGTALQVDAYGSACGVTITSMRAGAPAGVVHIKPAATMHGGPQIAVGSDGRGWVAWATEGDAGAFDKLSVAPVLVPAVVDNKKAGNVAGRAKLVAPVGCLPPVKAAARLAAKPKRGWTLASRSMKLGTTVVRTKVDGAKLKPGRTYVLKGTAVFRKGATTRTLKLSAKFVTCS